MQPFSLHVENCMGIDFDSLLFHDIACQPPLVFLFGRDKSLHKLRIVQKGLQLVKLLIKMCIRDSLHAALCVFCRNLLDRGVLIDCAAADGSIRLNLNIIGFAVFAQLHMLIIRIIFHLIDHGDDLAFLFDAFQPFFIEIGYADGADPSFLIELFHGFPGIHIQIMVGALSLIHI